jgi:hypothetical protein
MWDETPEDMSVGDELEAHAPSSRTYSMSSGIKPVDMLKRTGSDPATQTLTAIPSGRSNVGERK